MGNAQKKKESFGGSFFMFCAFSRFARFDCLARKRKRASLSLCSPSLRNKPDSVEDSHLSGMIVTNHLKRFLKPYRWHDLIRPCTQVGFLPLHLGPLTAQARPASHKATQGGFLLSQKTVSVRIPRITPTGVTRYRSADFVKNKISACPDFPLALASQRLPNADMKCSKD